MDKVARFPRMGQTTGGGGEGKCPSERSRSKVGRSFGVTTRARRSFSRRRRLRPSYKPLASRNLLADSEAAPSSCATGRQRKLTYAGALSVPPMKLVTFTASRRIAPYVSAITRPRHSLIYIQKTVASETSRPASCTDTGTIMRSASGAIDTAPRARVYISISVTISAGLRWVLLMLQH